MFIIVQDVLRKMILSELDRASQHPWTRASNQEAFEQSVKVYKALKEAVMALDNVGCNFVIEIGPEDEVNIDELPDVSYR